MPRPMPGPCPRRTGRGGCSSHPCGGCPRGQGWAWAKQTALKDLFFFFPSNWPTGSIEQSAVFWFVLVFLLHFFSPLVPDIRLHVG